MRDALLFGTKVIVGICPTYALLLVGIRIVGYQLKKAAVTDPKESAGTANPYPTLNYLKS
jgi:hypothetical protein